MTIMTASMHHAVGLRFVIKVGLLRHWQRIHIRAQHDRLRCGWGRTGLTVQYADNARFADAGYNRVKSE